MYGSHTCTNTKVKVYNKYNKYNSNNSIEKEYNINKTNRNIYRNSTNELVVT